MEYLNKIQITDEQEKSYVNNNGIKCLNPECNNNDLHGGPIEIDGPIATQNITCPECNWTWTDIYKLTGIDRDNIYKED